MAFGLKINAKANIQDMLYMARNQHGFVMIVKIQMLILMNKNAVVTDILMGI
jgi:hypothetical protein